jgi:hypothetical protein
MKSKQTSVNTVSDTHPKSSNFAASLLPTIMTDLPDYLTDAYQRTVLFLDLLRRRGDEEQDMTSRPMATVLRYEQEIILSGHTLKRPINYMLSRIVAPTDITVDEKKRPVVVVDPRAGQGPGIGGFKADSEIGDALAEGHPVYFIGFSAEPVKGQEFLDVVEGQVKFVERVVELHPDSPLPFAIGNCQAGYQTLMGAVLRPDLYGPCLLAGAPVSYWQGEHGKNPMRYSGGLLGGSWLTALASDLGHGTFDGTALVENFNSLNPANSLWGKQYEVYRHVDTNAKRYLEFEKWWGDFIKLEGGEMQFLVDNLFIGDKLTRNELKSHDGTTFDLRNVTSPIIVFTSKKDNISPPPQTLGWILDLYHDAQAIRESGHTIIYCINQEVGHLGLFVSSKVGAKEDEEFVQLMDIVDCIPPGLYEIIISPRAENEPITGFVTGNWTARFEPRNLDDIRAYGRNTPSDDRAFTAAAKVSENNLTLYRNFMQPMIKAMVTEQSAELLRSMNSTRLGYTLFSDANLWMNGFQALAKKVSADRKPVCENNPFITLQDQYSNKLQSVLDAWRISRDQASEQIFFGFYGSPVVQALLGINENDNARPIPEVLNKQDIDKQKNAAVLAHKLRHGTFDEALTRAVLYVSTAEIVIEQRTALAFNVARKQLMKLSLDEFKAMVREQFQILQEEHEQAIEAIVDLIPNIEIRESMTEQVEKIVSVIGVLTPLQQERLDRLKSL